MYEARTNWIIVRPVERVSETESGLYIPDSAKDDRVVAGEVITRGPKVDTCNPGETIIYDSRIATPVKIAGVQHWIIRNENVIAEVTS